MGGPRLPGIHFWKSKSQSLTPRLPLMLPLFGTANVDLKVKMASNLRSKNILVRLKLVNIFWLPLSKSTVKFTIH